MKATEVTAGLAESNGRLLLGIWRDSLHVTCRLTACTPGSALGPTLGNEYGKTLRFLIGWTAGQVPVVADQHVAELVQLVQSVSVGGGAVMLDNERYSSAADITTRGMHVDISSRSSLSLLQYARGGGGSVAEWLACWTQAQKGPGSDRSRDAVR